MKTRPTRCSRCWRPAGLTLIEVIAAVVILGTILVGIVMAKSQHTRQAAATGRQNAAVRAADELIAGWWSTGNVPVGQSGPVESDASLTWRTSEVPNEAVARLGARVVRVEIRSASPAGTPAPDGADAAILAVELVLPCPEPQGKTDTHTDRGHAPAAPGGGPS